MVPFSYVAYILLDNMWDKNAKASSFLGGFGLHPVLMALASVNLAE
jgi:hypothetical protein